MMNSTLRSASKIGNIPDAILAEILKRLSVKTLLICRSVQKSWYHFLQTPDFINLQFIYQQINTTHLPLPPKYLLFKDIFENHVFSLRFDDKQCQELPIKIQIPPALLDKHTKLNVLTSFSLICLYCDATSFPRCMKRAFFDIYFWNPLVQKYKTLPDVPLIPPRIFSCRIYWRDLAFGYVPEVDDYLVVTIVCFGDGIDEDGNAIRSCFVCVYSLKNNSWKKIIFENEFDYVEKIDRLFEPLILNGNAFWRGDKQWGLQDLVYYDIINNVVGSILLPVETWVFRSTNPYMRQSGQSIVCIANNYRDQQEQVHLWALKERLINNWEGKMRKYFDWEKKTCVSLDNIARLEFVGSRNNGELILPQLYQCHLVSYNVEKDEVNNFVQLWYRWFSHGIAKGKNNYDFEDRKLDILAVPFSVYPFVESLVLLDAT